MHDVVDSPVPRRLLSDGSTQTLPPLPKVKCNHALSKWNILFTYGHCQLCGTQLKAEGKLVIELTNLEFEREKCEVAFRASKYMQVVDYPEAFTAYWDGWKTAKCI